MSPNPPEAQEASAALYEGMTTSRYGSKIGLKLLADWLGPSAAGVTSGFLGAARLSFQIRGTRLLTVSPAAIMNALPEAEPSQALMGLNGARMYVITEALQMKRLTMIAENNTAGKVSLTVPATPGVPPAGARGEVTVEAEREQQGLVHFSCNQFHTIGYKVFELEIAEGGFQLIATKNPTDDMRMSSDEPNYESVLLDPEPL